MLQAHYQKARLIYWFACRCTTVVLGPAEAGESRGLFAMRIDETRQSLQVVGGLVSSDAQAGCSFE
jgi:hypothetical protein